MKKFYLILPVVLLGLFLFVYLGHREEMQKKAQIAAEAAAKEAAAVAAKKAEAEERARKDAEERTRKREEEEKKKEDDKRAKYEGDLATLKKATDDANATANRLAKEAADLEIKLAELRKKRAEGNTHLLELAKAVELAKIEKRTAEMEIQRTTEIVSRRAAESALVTPPPPPAAKS